MSEDPKTYLEIFAEINASRASTGFATSGLLGDVVIMPDNFLNEEDADKFAALYTEFTGRDPDKLGMTSSWTQR